MINIFFYTLLGTLAFGYANPEIDTELVVQKKNCLTLESFNSVASFVEDYGEQINISERLLSVEGSLVLEVSVGRKFVLLEKHQDLKNIIIKIIKYNLRHIIQGLKLTKTLKKEKTTGVILL